MPQHRTLRRALAMVVLATVAGCAGTLDVAPLPASAVHSIHKPCSCSGYREGDTPGLENVLFSTGHNKSPARLNLNGTVLSLKRAAAPSGTTTYVNNYESTDVQVSTSTRQVSWDAHCARYPDPPAHGTCFLGRMTVTQKWESVTVPIVFVCGC